MKIQRQNILVLLLCMGVLLSSCKDKWDEHNKANSPLLTETLLAQINANPDLSKFSEYLTATGYDNVLASSKSFTAWVPTNAALQTLDPTVINTAAKLKLFVANHIAYQLHPTTEPKNGFVRIKTLNGKNVTFTKTTVDESGISTGNISVGNGLMHIINKAITPKVSAWEYLMSTSSLQKQELASLNYNFFDVTKAEQISVDPKTGAPVYKPGSGVSVLNTYLKVNDISNEDSLYTYIVLTDAAFNAEKAKLTQFYQTTAADTTDSLTKYSVIKDLAFRGVYESDKFPPDVYSTKDSVRFHLDKNAIVETRRVSNGIVYVMSSVNYDLYSTQTDSYGKLKPVIIQGELPAAFQSTKTYSLRSTRNIFTGKPYVDILVENHGVSAYWIKYNATVNSMKYKVFWVAINNVQLQSFPMKIAFKSPTATDFTGYTNVPPLTSPNSYSELELGSYTLSRYYTTANPLNMRGANPLAVYLVSNNVVTNGLNTLVLDYIKLVPAP